METMLLFNIQEITQTKKYKVTGNTEKTKQDVFNLVYAKYNFNTPKQENGAAYGSTYIIPVFIYDAGFTDTYPIYNKVANTGEEVKSKHTCLSVVSK